MREREGECERKKTLNPGWLERVEADSVYLKEQHVTDAILIPVLTIRPGACSPLAPFIGPATHGML